MSAQPKNISSQQRWIRAFILIIGAFVFLCFLALDPLLRHYRKDDFKSVLPQQGVATVITLVLPAVNIEGDTKGDQQRPLVGVRFRNGIYNAARVYDVKHLKLEQPAQIIYRVGKSGRIVVDSVEPMPAIQNSSSR